jgi:hypothetical protein
MNNRKNSRREFMKNAASGAATLFAGSTLLSQLSCTANPPQGVTQALIANDKPIKTKLILEGGFIELWGGMLTDQSFNSLGPCAWKQVLQAMRDLRMNTIIIKRTQTDADDFIQTPNLPKTILKYANDNPKMEVFIGTRNTAVWDPTAFRDNRSSTDPNKLWRDEEKEKNLALIQRIWDSYKKDDRFAGWYISQEIGNEPGWYELLPELKDYYGSICGKCKELSKNKPIALSPYFNPFSTATDTFLEADRFAEEYAKFLDQLKVGDKYLVDIVMLQDSVGERNIPQTDLEKIVVPYFNAFSKICSDRKIKFWGNIESFSFKNGQRSPASSSRLTDQIRVLPDVVQKLVTFDFFHYMNPYNHLYYDPAFKQAQKDLYNNYNNEFVKNNNLKVITAPC